jgi:cytoskeletal protein RodZ
MKTVGEILKLARLQKGIKRREIVKKTKISLNYIKALESNNFRKLPESAFVKGFIRNYANTVDLDPEQALAVFRRDYDQNIKGKVISRKLMPSTIARRSIWNPKTTMVAGILILSVILASYLVYQYRLLTSAPFLEVSSPEEQEIVMATLTITGKTDPQAIVAINNQQVLVDNDGSFNQSLDLPQGTRTITISSTSRSGKSRVIQRTVNVEP